MPVADSIWALSLLETAARGCPATFLKLALGLSLLVFFAAALLPGPGAPVVRSLRPRCSLRRPGLGGAGSAPFSGRFPDLVAQRGDPGKPPARLPGPALRGGAGVVGRRVAGWGRCPRRARGGLRAGRRWRRPRAVVRGARRSGAEAAPLVAAFLMRLRLLPTAELHLLRPRRGLPVRARPLRDLPRGPEARCGARRGSVSFGGATPRGPCSPT